MVTRLVAVDLLARLLTLRVLVFSEEPLPAVFLDELAAFRVLGKYVTLQHDSLNFQNSVTNAPNRREIRDSFRINISSLGP